MKKYQKPQIMQIGFESSGLICQSESQVDPDGLIYNMDITDLTGDL